MKIAGVVILYYPDESVLNNILTYHTAIQKLYIVDNSEKQNEVLNNSFTILANTQYIHDTQNRGIAERLNQVCKYAIADGYDWLLTMDQDSSFQPDQISQYFFCADAYINKNSVSMFGVNYSENTFTDSSCLAKKVTQLITSGSLINLSHFREVGGFEEKLFIDEVDIEYCFRSIQSLFEIVEFSHIMLIHKLGTTSKHISLKTGKSTNRILHSPVRIYYITRNYFYLSAHYKKYFEADLTQRRKALLNRIKNNLLYNKNRVQVLGYIIKAIVDYNRGKMGK